MFAHATIKFRFDFNTTEAEIQDIILTGEYFPHNIIDCEVVCHE